MRFKPCLAAASAVLGVLIAGSSHRAQAQIDTLPYNPLNYNYAPQTYFNRQMGEYGSGAHRDTSRSPYNPPAHYAPQTYYYPPADYGTGTPDYPQQWRSGADTPYSAGTQTQYPYYGGYYYGAWPAFNYSYGGPLIYGRYGDHGRVGYRYGWW
jgi:hypothetical protein